MKRVGMKGYKRKKKYNDNNNMCVYDNYKLFLYLTHLIIFKFKN